MGYSAVIYYVLLCWLPMLRDPPPCFYAAYRPMEGDTVSISCEELDCEAANCSETLAKRRFGRARHLPVRSSGEIAFVRSKRSVQNGHMSVSCQEYHFRHREEAQEEIYRVGPERRTEDAIG